MDSQSINPSKLHSICLNCCGLIGDVLIRTPFIEAIAKLCPQATITVIVDTGKAELLQHHPNISDIIIFNRQKKPILDYLKNFICFLWQLRQRRFDLFINLYGGGSSVGISKLSRAKYRIGFYRQSKEARAYTHSYPWPDFAGHWGKEFGLLLQPFGLGSAAIRAGTTFIPTTTAMHEAKKILQASAKPWVLLNMGSGDLRKIWPVANFFALATWLSTQKNFHIGVFVNLGQEFLAQEFVQLAQQNNFTDYTLLRSNNFSLIGALIKQAKFFISGDTGLLHLAFGIKAPTIALFTYTQPQHVLPEDCVCIPCVPETDGKPISVTQVKTAVELLVKKIGTY